MSRKQLYALIKWIEDDTYTPGVPIEWIKFFDYNNFLSGNFDSTQSVPIEWRNIRKEPRGGWPCYDGLIIAISEKISKLEKKLQMLEGIKSPRCLTAADTEHYSLKKKKDKKHKKINKENVNNSGSFEHAKKSLLNDEEININKSNTNKSIKKRNQISELITQSTKKKCINYEVPSTSYLQKTTEKITPVNHNIELKQKRPLQIMFDSSYSEKDESYSEKDDFKIDTLNISTFSKLNEVTLETLHEDHLKTQAMIQQLLSSVQKTKLTLAESNDTKSAFIEEEMVEIQPGSKVKVRSRDWKLALSRPTFTAMGLTLLTILFPHEVLLRSNLKGGPSKINRTDGNKAVFTALNPRTLNALIYAVEKQHPSTFKESLLGAAINNKLNVLRRNALKNLKTPDEEEEEAEDTY